MQERNHFLGAFLGLGLAIILTTGVAHAQIELRTVAVYTAGAEGYHTFRIPAIIQTPNFLLAFCEGRVQGMGDSGDIDLVLKRSDDGGEHWSEVAVVVHQAGFTCGNPAPVWDRETGEVILVWTRNPATASEARILTGEDPPRSVWVMRSADEGATWTEPVDISAAARKEGWRWYATGPGHAIQLQSGRLLVPANHSASPDHLDWRSHVIFSDDHGKSWAIGGIHYGFTNESTVAELVDGRIYQNMRSYRNENRRRVSYSRDGGSTWTPDTTDETLVEPVCQASTLSVPARADRPASLYFSNPAATSREKMTVRRSEDGGKSWAGTLELYAGPSAYSDLVLLPSGDIACLYERGDKNPYESIVLTRFNPAALSRK